MSRTVTGTTDLPTAAGKRNANKYLLRGAGSGVSDDLVRLCSVIAPYHARQAKKKVSLWVLICNTRVRLRRYVGGYVQLSFCV